MGITQNLYLALHHLRFEDQDRILWIDAICIDQGNVEERGHQVRQMADIYKKAERVIIWLGPATHETNVVMRSMKEMQDESINYAYKNWMASDHGLFQNWSAVRPEVRSVEHEGLKVLLGRPWFKRIWILQEVANAR